MQFSSTNEGGSKAGKFLLVAGLHVAIAAFFIHSMNSRHLSLTGLHEQVLVMLEPQRTEPPPPPPPPMPQQSLPMLPLLPIPQPEVDVAPPDAPPIHATTTPDPSPLAATPAQGVADAPAGPHGPVAKSTPSQMRTAVLADAKACALPDYPARAAREGITGTTMLALLVGADGRVSASRIEHSSGSRDLDRAAVNALSLCKFKPATNNGVPEAAWAQLAYVWTLD